MINFIEEYPNQVSVNDCNSIIDWFESNVSMQCSGHSIGGGKVSKDISLDFYEDSFINKIILSGLETSIFQYKEKYPYLNNIPDWNVFWFFNIQRYLPGEGYPKPHHEWSRLHSDRMLVWTLYLNDVIDAGETYFPQQDQYVKSETGKIVLFPTDWTHMHHGVISNTQTKYIATGWFNYIDLGVSRVR